MDDDAFSEASLDPDDMSISGTSYDGDNTEMFPGNEAPCDSITSTFAPATEDLERTNFDSPLDQYNLSSPDLQHTLSHSQEKLDTDRTDTIQDVNEATDKIPHSSCDIARMGLIALRLGISITVSMRKQL